MNNYSRFCLMAIVSCLLSCDDENTVPENNDVQNPSVEITSPWINNSYVKGTVRITGNASDDNQVKNIELFLDDTKLTEVTGEAVNFEWDTKSVEDGVHTIKLIARDMKGNETDVTQEVNVLNYFFKIDLINPQISDNIDLWFFVSRQDGTTAAIKQYKPGDMVIRLETPDDFEEGQIFTLAQFHYTNSTPEASFENGSLTFIPIQTAGSYNYNADMIYDDSSELLGVHQLKITDVTERVITLAGGVLYFGNNPEITDNIMPVNIPVYHGIDKSRVVILPDFDKTPLFKEFSGFTSGGTTTISLNDFSPMSGHTIPMSADAIEGSAYVYGVVDRNDYSKLDVQMVFFRFDQNCPFLHPLYYVPETYDEFRFDLYETWDNGGGYYSVISTSPPSGMQRVEAKVSNFTSVNGVINADISGAYDYGSISGQEREQFDDRSIHRSWSVLLDGTNKLQFTIPELPNEITTNYQYPAAEALAFTSTTFIDYFDVTRSDVETFLKANPEGNTYSISKSLGFLNSQITQEDAQHSRLSAKQRGNFVQQQTTQENIRRQLPFRLTKK